MNAGQTGHHTSGALPSLTWKWRWLPLALCLLALAVRLQQLTYHSLWFDEAMSVHWARSDVARILEVSMQLQEDRLPPAYYLLLHAWRQVWGEGETAVRLPSVICGVLLVAVTCRLAAMLFGRRGAWLAGALAAFNPFLVWYSQEARMYALAALFASLGSWCFLEALQQPRRRRWLAGGGWWVAYGLCAALGLYTHLYTGFVLPAHALYLARLGRRGRHARLPYAITMLVVAGAYLPLALATLRVSGEAGAGQPWVGWGERAWWLLTAFTVWKAPLAPVLALGIPLVSAALALAGVLLPPLRSLPEARPARRVAHPRLWLALLLVTPLVIATLSLLRNRLAFFGERYFIVMVPWLLIAMARGAWALTERIQPLRRAGRPAAWRSLPTAGFVLLPLALVLLPLPGQWSPSARREAWRETVAYLAVHARPEDGILIHPDWTRYPFQYYFRGPGQTYAVFSSVEGHTDLDGPLTVISRRHPVLWLVESHTELADAQHRVNAWLAARYPLVTELYPPGLIAVRAYAPGYLTSRLPENATPAAASFQGGLRLVGYWLPQTRTPAGDDLFHPPSAWLHVALYWQATMAAPDDCRPFVHLVDDLGQVWGAALERPNDAFGLLPPTRWPAGSTVRADYDVNLNPITPPGRYTLVVGLRDLAGRQLPLTDGAAQAPLTAIEVVE